MLEFAQTYAKEIVALLAPILTYASNRLSRGRAHQLAWGTRHQHVFVVQEPLLGNDGEQIAASQNVRTVSVVVHNQGKQPLTNVDLVLNYKPMYHNVWAPRVYEEQFDVDKRYTMKFASFAPNEWITIELLSINKDLPALVNLRSDQCVGKQMQISVRPSVNAWYARAVMGLALVGTFATAYGFLLLIQFLVVSTPVGPGR